MLHKVFKHMKKIQGTSPDAKPVPYNTSQYTKPRGHSGIHAKKDSTKGASRQRSMGNRDSKSGK
ncbi:MAG: hypothetical protein CO029_02035 [Candidatus Magasanikbacteria bacterium CG_4_9_14_0_2_um_filter_41_10]|uniref:Uncharacterized protein n=1 Tax=Candidatus Magasanikbacteria bacterium CG_4_10_14_0_2_um_filter_41_31 TaxID=1974639 RepID=A0A2M7V623_9BACT|nr:MAG: hypothetical protein AUJ37_00320 [Candidatus Magasanikbacteria bacterium CG1_02_41_34]PIZ93996.1 MAG: hypothetical protein COX83_00400 [Candidatus Magasanikbacteria bacterium CG_4_10_14_0_2_um_filter_41_31]PJC53580.1 MAG: hypothetical protein CO029_02035 [Candidatus Magasanikbacteria bacterium CG_4_9_14_0_2_um_filter_41_10]